MRLKNVKGANEIIEKGIYYIKNPNENINNWSKVFKSNNPIYIEIGMGKGDFIIKMAELHPEYNFLGIEKYESVLVRAVEKIEKTNLPNVFVIRYDAADLNNIIEKEIDTIYLNFSDPWPKKRHEKRRLTSETFLPIYDKIFKGRKRIIQKTDNIELFGYSIVSLSKYGYTIEDVSLDLHSTDKENSLTEYEKKFSDKGYKINYLEALKK